ncbi:SIS domain-containing protein [Vagococcus elongatus]|uniref:Tagatose-6-phosphate ketose isomerase n=1 Tax=Vagococcus elongatus TaxID=180344 RepID=A0A430AY67_9ENTE|nr:SIS domain-containing protein [Vagococcus elongatus]RSU13007.1 tagatose-6-phosphate ketose isomerase [Vagococcus elongatus]
MLKWTEEQLNEVGGKITAKEIKQQPELWEETYEIYENHREKLNLFLKEFEDKVSKKIRIIFTGAGTSAYVGDVVKPHLIRFGDTKRYQFEAIPTTDIVSAPHSFLKEDEPTVLVSFARSGNSPESVAAIRLADKIVKDLRHLIITCAPEGQLANDSRLSSKSFLLLMPALSNDKGFAMTGSFSCMTLTALLTFDKEHTEKKVFIDTMVAMGHQAVELEEKIQHLVDHEFDRVVYLGSGSLSALTREAQLKLLELTAGKVTTAFDSSMGFRHGPKSFVNEKTIVFTFISNDPYTQQYDRDILDEIKGNGIAVNTVAIAQNKASFDGESLELISDKLLPDGYAALPFVMIAQIFALLTAIKVGNKPDTPSPTGTVNRVVKGVTIHEL